MPTRSRSTTWVLALASVATAVSAALSLAGALAGLGLPGRARTVAPASRPALETT